MNLENRTISVVSLMSSSAEARTVVRVDVSEEVIEGVYSVIKSLELTFGHIFAHSGDPILLGLISEKLSLVPE